MKIVYLGPEKTFTEKAAKEFFPDLELTPLQPIRNVIMAVENEKADFAIIPIENFYNGEVRETLDVLTECNKAKIVQEKALPIVHCLGALTEHKKIEKIYSKDQALEQCSSYLYKKFPEAKTISTESTASAVERIKKENFLDSAVIASESAIIDWGLQVLDKNLVPNNKTRFVLVSNQKTEKTGKDKTFIAIHPQVDKAGILNSVLGFFSSFGINLECIISRPDKRKGYYFYIELDGHEKDKNVETALNSIKFFLDPENKFSDSIKILGSYPNTKWKD